MNRNASMFSGWAVKFVPSPTKLPQVSAAEVDQTLKLASQHQDTHILGFSTQPDRQRFADRIKAYFRFRWFDHILLKHLGSPDPFPFLNQLAADLAQESTWADRVKPSDLNSPLLLPECAFSAARKHSDLWRHACSYGDSNNIDGAEKAIGAFQSCYRRRVDSGRPKQSKWVDEQDRIFDHDGPRHGAAPFPRDWKYSFRIEIGFHFDVKSLSGKQFFLCDALGERNRIAAGAHLNMDSHGYVR
ncbi:MAG: hypothetical protein ABSC08_15195 [Bryobacteraceae bacterium]